MAKKRKKEEKKEAFKKPEFDEIEFMQKEISNTKVAMLTIMFALPIAVVSYFVTIGGLPAAGFLIGVGSIFLLKYVYEFFNVETENFGMKEKLGNGAMFFFTWLAVWVLILNMPFGDLTNPTISDVKMLGCPDDPIIEMKGDTQHTCTIDASSNDFTIEARVTDNSDVKSVTIHITSPGDETQSMTESSDHEYRYTKMLSPNDNLVFYIVAEDINGHKETSEDYTFSVLLA
ncbi:MAG: hypothetical protein KAW09_10430 [Thermoplasmata archaeon]|nr:hypothetical protein [Thermoplasmata archaeon]